MEISVTEWRYNSRVFAHFHEKITTYLCYTLLKYLVVVKSYFLLGKFEITTSVCRKYIKVRKKKSMSYLKNSFYLNLLMSTYWFGMCETKCPTKLYIPMLY